jgi:hypothetical protein
LHCPEDFPAKLPLLYIFDILYNNSWQNVATVKKPSKREDIMNISKALNHFFNYQKLNVKKKYDPEL